MKTCFSLFFLLTGFQIAAQNTFPSTGNVGVNLGTASATNVLQIGPNNQSWTSNDLLISNANGGLAIHNTPDHTYLYGSTSIAIRPGWGRMSIFAHHSGSVGIQSVNPQGSLQISDYRPVIIKPNGGNGVYGSEIGFNAVLNTSVAPNTFRKLGGTSQNGGASIAVDYNGNMLFQMFDGSTESEVVTNYHPQVAFKNNGHIGIGTTDPQAPLDVKGRQLYLGTIPITIGYSATEYPSIGYNTTYTESPFSYQYKSNDNASLIYFGEGGFHFKTAPVGTPGGAIAFTEVLTIKQNGDVSIGTTDSHGYRLAIAGKAVAEEIVVKLQGTWPDYVFSNEYKLPSLTEVEQFIRINKHLPQVPRAQDVEENGLPLGDMNAILLKKIEELTLYMIALKKENENLTKRVEELEHR